MRADRQPRTPLHRYLLSPLLPPIISQTNRISRSLWIRLLRLPLVLLHLLLMKENNRSYRHNRNNRHNSHHSHHGGSSSSSSSKNNSRNTSKWFRRPLLLPLNPVAKDRLFLVPPLPLEP